MIKRTVIIGLVSLLLLNVNSLHAQQTFKISGHITRTDADSGTILISYNDGNTFRFDTASVHQGNFTVHGTVGEPHKAQLFWSKPNPPGSEKRNETSMQPFYLESGEIQVKGEDIAQAQIHGGPVQKEYNALKSRLNQAGLSVLSTSDSDAGLKKKKAQVELNFMRDYPNSPVSFDLMRSLATAYFLSKGTEEIEDILTSFPQTWHNSEDGVKIQERIAAAKVLGVGKTAIDFTSKDTLGNPVSLSDFEGKYVLLDFWASWCAPCRAENPNLIKAYEKYKDKNFTILGVSLDGADARQAWINAIQEDGLTWPQVSDLEGWDTKVARDYHIQSIPMNYLIDPNGKIIAVSLRGEQLFTELQEHL